MVFWNFARGFVVESLSRLNLFRCYTELLMLRIRYITRDSQDQ